MVQLMTEKTVALTFQKDVTANEISIEIRKPINVVFPAVINSDFAHLWLPVAREERDEPIVRVGTMYRDRLNGDDAWSYYTVIELNALLSIRFAKVGTAREDGFYCTPIGGSVTKLTYKEQNPNGIPEPATVAMLEKFKRVLEEA